MFRPSNPSPAEQSALTAVELTLKDGLRALSVNLSLGAHWLVDDVAPRLAQQIDPDGKTGKREKLHLLMDSAARGTLSTLETVQHRAASKAMADEPYRELDFQLLPLAAYFSSQEQRNPSGLFAEVFYWLIRHALEMTPMTQAQPWIVRQLAVDEAFWLVQSGRYRAVAGSNDENNPAQDLARLSAQVLRALRATQPVRDATLLPWAHAGAAAARSPELLHILLTAVLAVGIVTASDGNTSQAAQALRLGHQIAAARLAPFEKALAPESDRDDGLLAAEFLFVYRHI